MNVGGITRLVEIRQRVNFESDHDVDCMSTSGTLQTRILRGHGRIEITVRDARLEEVARSPRLYETSA